MKVREFMTQGVSTIDSSDMLNAAARVMWEQDCGCVPVVDSEARVVGMVTDRDLCMAAYMADEPLSAIPVTRAMSKTVHSCRPDDTVAAAEATMRKHQIRRLPVLDEKNRLLGILSINDIAIEADSDRAHKVSPSEVGMTLAAISRHRTLPRAIPVM